MAKASLPAGWRIAWTREDAAGALSLNPKALVVKASSVSMAFWEHGLAAWGRQEDEGALGSVEIRLPEIPVLDEIWCLYMLAARERGEPRGRGWERMASYAQDVRGGFWPDRVPPEHAVQGVFSGILHEHLGGDQPDREAFLADALELCRYVDEKLEGGADLLKSDVTDAPKLQRYRAALANDHKLYDEDVKRGSRWHARVPAARAEGRERKVGLLVLRKPLSRQFKMWARTDPHAPGGKGYPLLLVEQSVTGEIVLSADPTARLKVGWLAARLDRLEGAPEAHWYDGIRHGNTLVASPKDTRLTLDAVLGELRREVKLRRVWNRSVVRMISIAAAVAVIACSTIVIVHYRQRDPGKQIARDNRDHVYLVVMPKSHRICTAFAVGPHELATARHCLRDADGGPMLVIRNNTPADRRAVLRTCGDATKDVALLQVRDALPGAVPLGSLSDDIQGSTIFVFGFPVETTNPEFPQAHMASTLVSIAPNTDDLQHDGIVSGGSSGSPVFDVDGRVIAVHSGAQGDVYDGKTTPFGHAVPIEWVEKLMQAPRWVDIPQ